MFGVEKLLLQLFMCDGSVLYLPEKLVARLWKSEGPIPPGNPGEDMLATTVWLIAEKDGFFLFACEVETSKW